MRLFIVVALLLWLAAAGSAQAGLIGVTEIRIKTALINRFVYLSELVATQAVTGSDLALASAGASASGSATSSLLAPWSTGVSPVSVLA